MNLNKIFYPQSIAVIGASTRIGSVGNDIVKNLVEQNFAGKIYPINPNATELYNLPCFASINDISENIDLVIIVIPAALVLDVMKDIVNKKVKGIVIVSAGFKESGHKDWEDQIKEIALQNDIALIGPNCLGVINPEIKMNASFAGIMPEMGNLAFLSQSGALCTSVLDYAKNLKIGFSKFVSVGNKACMDEVDFLKYFYGDVNTKVIAIYTEQLSKSQALIEAVKKLSKSDIPKPVILIKSGRTSAGASASASHTGALGGNDAIYEALFNQSGIIRAGSVSELFDFIQAFNCNLLPKGNRLAIITNAGGPGVLATDEAVLNGLVLAKLSEETENKLKLSLPEAANVHNPVDVLGDAKADRYGMAIEAVAQDKNVDSMVVILTPQSMTESETTAEVIISVKKQYNKPIIACFMGKETVSGAINKLRQTGISAINYPEQAVRAIAALTKFSEITKEKDNLEFEIKDVNKNKVIEIFNQAKSENINKFPEAEALKILDVYNFPVLKSVVARNADEAEKIANEFGTTLVMKIVSQDILHKSDIGGVMLSIEPKDVKEKFTEMMNKITKAAPEAKIDGILITEMVDVKSGVELILGSVKDAALGSTIMVGFGGIYVEVFKDVTFGVVPISKTDAEKMISRIKVKKLFEGVRGGPALDVDALIECLGRLSKLISDFPEIIELDINPLLVLPKGRGVKVLDARIVI